MFSTKMFQAGVSALMLLISVMSLFEVRSVSGCMCTSLHPQQHYCRANYVIRGRVVALNWIGRETTSQSHSTQPGGNEASANQGEGMSTTKQALTNQGEGMSTTKQASSNQGEGMSTTKQASSNQREGMSTTKQASTNQGEGMSTTKQASTNRGEGLSTTSQFEQAPVLAITPVEKPVSTGQPKVTPVLTPKAPVSTSQSQEEGVPVSTTSQSLLTEILLKFLPSIPEHKSTTSKDLNQVPITTSTESNEVPAHSPLVDQRMIKSTAKEQPWNSEILYTFKIEEVFKKGDEEKGNGESLRVGDEIELRTPNPEGVFCGVELKTGKAYVLAGAVEGRITRCDLIMENKKLTKRQKQGFRNNYGSMCEKCQIVTCHSRRCSQSLSDGACAYMARDDYDRRGIGYQDNDCIAAQSRCIPKGHGEQCTWQRNQDLRKCMVNTADNLP